MCSLHFHLDITLTPCPIFLSCLLLLLLVLPHCYASLVPIPSTIDDVASTDGLSDEPCIGWLEELLARALLKSRILLLSHWASTAAAAAALTTRDKDKTTTIIISGSSDSSRDQARVPLSLTAAISKLRHPLLAHPHRNVGNSGESPS